MYELPPHGVQVNVPEQDQPGSESDFFLRCPRNPFRIPNNASILQHRLQDMLPELHHGDPEYGREPEFP